MGKLKDKFKEKIKSIFKSFPLTLIIGFLFTIFLAVIMDTELVDEDIIANVSIFSVLFAIGTFTVESIMKKKISKKKLFFYILSAVFAALITFLVNIQNDIFGIENAIFVGNVFKFAITYFISLLLFSLFALYKMSGQKFNEYVTKVAVNMFKSGIIYSLIASGVSTILGIFCLLLLGGEHYTIILRAELILFGFFLMPKLMYSLVDVDGEVNRFFEIIFKYVLDILLIIAFVVIYLYIGKILILREMPVNQIYRIAAALFILGVPIWTITSYFEDKKIISKINRYLPIAFTPFVLLQIYTIGVRILNNGLTELRYIAVMLILFEIIYIAIYIKNREKVGACALVLIAMTVISAIVPGINMFKMSELSQYSILKKYDSTVELSSEQKAKIKGAYNYLRGSDNGEKYIDKALTEEEKKEVANMENSYYDDIFTGRQVISVNNDLDYINISGYNRMYEIDDYNYSEKSIDNAFKNVKCENGNKSIDLSSIFVNGIKEGNLEESIENREIIQINSDSAVVLEYVYIIYNEDNEIVTQYSIKGYLLEK